MPTVRAKATTMRTLGGPRTMMGPSSSSRWRWGQATSSSPLLSVSTTSRSSSASSDDEAASWIASTGTSVAPQRHPDEPNLYLIPPNLHPSYRPLPILMRLSLALAAVLMAAGSTWSKLTWLSPLMAVTSNARSVKKIASFLVKGILTYLLTNAALQDLLRPPSRVSTANLLQKYCLPSTLSRYEKIALPPADKNDEKPYHLGVHWLQYAPLQSTKPSRFQAIYVNHGFGASSLSWLPVLPCLVDRLGARVGLGHDATGFGFTNRPGEDEISRYTSIGSAQIGLKVLERTLQDNDSSNSIDNNNTNEKPIVIMGHSMGAIAALRMALDLPKEARKWVVLVAPAVGMMGRPRSPNSSSKKKGEQSRRNNSFRRAFVGLTSIPLRYALRRVVGSQDFWKRCLRQVWGNPDRVSDSDALRFQWPSVGMGWEDGLLKFARAQTQMSGTLDDAGMMEQLLRPDSNAVVTVVLGSRDRVVSGKVVKRFLEPFQSRVRVIEMQGMGHDPFEEDVNSFVQRLQNVLREDEERILASK